MKLHHLVGYAAALTVSALVADVARGQGMTFLGRYETGLFDGSAAEIPAYDPVTRRLFVTNSAANSVDILDVSNPAMPTLFNSIGVGGGPNSVAFANGIMAVAVENSPNQQPGTVAFYDASGNFLNAVGVGALPDGLTFSPNGTTLVVANEGEPEGYAAGQFDPEGSISVIDLSGGVASATVSTAGFGAFNGTTLDPSVRIFGPGATVAQDLEPEYVAFSADGQTAYVSLQENNAIATVDIATATVTNIAGLGFKDHRLAGNALDASDRDGGINIQNWPVYGMYQPDAIATYEVGGQTLIVTANEGDAREYDGFEEEARIKDLVLDPTAFPNAAELQLDQNLGRLTVTTTLGDTDGDGDYDELYALGARSFSIFQPDGTLVFDSGDALEQITAAEIPDFFNSTNDETDPDGRSDAKGPEPEGIALGEIDGATYAFVGLERVGGVAMFDITDPANVSFVDYLNPRDFLADPTTSAAGDLGPEGLLFISAADSPTGSPLLVVTNEVSGTTSIYSVVPEPGSLGALAIGGLMLLRRRK